MKKTNQARERISPHLKKGNENTDPQQESKRQSIDVKDINVKSTGNFSTASNEDYVDLASAAAKSTGGPNLFGKGSREAKNTSFIRQ